jgi:hypothetical protein
MGPGPYSLTEPDVAQTSQRTSQRRNSGAQCGFPRVTCRRQPTLDCRNRRLPGTLWHCQRRACGNGGQRTFPASTCWWCRSTASTSVSISFSWPRIHEHGVKHPLRDATENAAVAQALMWDVDSLAPSGLPHLRLPGTVLCKMLSQARDQHGFQVVSRLKSMIAKDAHAY